MSAAQDRAADAAEALAPLRTSRVALLTSFRRNGQGVGTPVSITVAEDRAYFTTWSKTAKVRRIANNPQVTLAPCTRMGKVLGDTVACTARRLTEDEARQLRGGSVQYRLWALFYLVAYRARPISYEVTPVLDEPAT